MKFHSYTDVITNSSTVIFTYLTANPEKYIRESVDELLKLCGSDKTFDDIFDVKIELSDWGLETAEEDWGYELTQEERDTYGSLEKYMEVCIQERLSEPANYEDGDRLELCLYTKDGQKFNLAGTFDVYDREASYQ